jgi:AraC family transcriptional regulator, positive regulator of tynA and feaB
LAGQVADLILQVPDLLAEAPAERANAPVLLSMMLDYIDRHSDDPDLGAATLAAKFNCSPRYVHKLFAGRGRSVGGHVNEKRILVCTRNLLDGTGRHRTIAEIAFAAGFGDVSHFNRLFRRSNDANPRQFRRAVRSAATRFSIRQEILRCHPRLAFSGRLSFGRALSPHSGSSKIGSRAQA